MWYNIEASTPHSKTLDGQDETDKINISYFISINIYLN